jgi:hypothetical protein
VFANSLYSFWWDVMKDWDLTLLSLSRKQRAPPLDPLTKMPEYPYGLRRHRYFVHPSIYYFVIAMDLLLRCTWSLKLSPHLHHINEWEGGIFILELLEVFRRWVVSLHFFIKLIRLNTDRSGYSFVQKLNGCGITKALCRTTCSWASFQANMMMIRRNIELDICPSHDSLLLSSSFSRSLHWPRARSLHLELMCTMKQCCSFDHITRRVMYDGVPR